VIGGRQTVDGQEVSSQTTTGVVMESSGAILSSQFAFAGEVDAILVETSAGQRRPARVVATDFIRRLVLLQADGADWTPAAGSNGAVRVGQWAIAAGRFYSADQCNVSLGIVSAKGRVNGLALQTDAKISPVNYGGPLLDLDGSVLGLLVPLSPSAGGGAMSGVEWYDSGIGFAIPWPDALAATERLRSGMDVKPGRLGLRLAAAGPFSTSVTIENVVRGGPADQAGLKVADQIVGVGSQPVSRVAVLEEAVARSSAGEVLVLNVRRGARELSLPVTLAATIPLADPAWLGLLPMESRGATEPDEQAPVPESDGVPVVVVEPSPAAAAGLRGHFIVTRVNDAPVTDRKQMQAALSGLEPGTEVVIAVRSRSDSADRTASMMPGTLDWFVPEPTGSFLNAIAGNESEAAGDATRQEWEFGERGRGIVFSAAAPASEDLQAGFPEPLKAAPVLLLSTSGQTEDEILAAWQPYLRSRRLVILIPRNPEGGPLTEDDLPLVIACLQRANGDLKVNLERTTLVASRSEAVLTWRLATAGVSPVRGVALTSGWLSEGDVQSAEVTGCAVLLPEVPADAQSAALLAISEKSLRAAGFPIMRMRPGDPVASIADWTLLLSAF
jgi:serine protease Do